MVRAIPKLTPAPPQGACAGGFISHFHVRALADGFRRAGRAWPAAGVTVAADGFDAAQLDALLNEPQLVVTPITEPGTE